MFITMNTVFVEDQPFFGTHLQGEIPNEDGNNVSHILEKLEPLDINLDAQYNRQLDALENSQESKENEKLFSETRKDDEQQISKFFGKVYERKVPNHRIEDIPDPATVNESDSMPENDKGNNFSDLNLPIALRKEKRSCVKYPISN
ncbi:unnamed protein product, partial [Cuscuta europaea]